MSVLAGQCCARWGHWNRDGRSCAVEFRIGFVSLCTRFQWVKGIEFSCLSGYEVSLLSGRKPVQAAFLRLASLAFCLSRFALRLASLAAANSRSAAAALSSSFFSR